MSENKLLRVTNDYVFKKIFGKKGNEDITKEFLRAVTNRCFESINLEETPILERDLLEKKMGVLDVKAVANEIENIDIEMQVINSEYIADRILWYWAKMYSSSLLKGDGYDRTKRVICIMIADFNLDRLKNILQYHTKWMIREENDKEVVLTDKLEIHIIELTKLESISCMNKKEKELMQWCKFIKYPESVEESIMNENKGIKRAKEELDKLSQDEHERWLADMREKAIRDEMAIRDYGYKEGLQKGLDDGLKEGIKQGIEQGEKNKQIEIAKKLINKKMEISIISEITGLTIQEIENLNN